jgi:hypothetical protein
MIFSKDAEKRKKKPTSSWLKKKKALNNLGIEQTYLSLRNITYSKPRANAI